MTAQHDRVHHPAPAGRILVWTTVLLVACVLGVIIQAFTVDWDWYATSGTTIRWIHVALVVIVVIAVIAVCVAVRTRSRLHIALTLLQLLLAAGFSLFIYAAIDWTRTPFFDMYG
jgi:hypothetical protein